VPKVVLAVLVAAQDQSLHRLVAQGTLQPQVHLKATTEARLARQQILDRVAVAHRKLVVQAGHQPLVAVETEQRRQ
jgi:hypothetical protein